VESERTGRSIVVICADQHNVCPVVTGRIEEVIAHNGVIIGVHVDPLDVFAATDSECERAETVFFWDDDHPIDVRFVSSHDTVCYCVPEGKRKK